MGSIRKKILFTGAGFTLNFGGFLAANMWNVIFNNKRIQETHKLRKKMLSKHNYDFESLYEEIIHQENEQEKSVFIKAVKSAYSLMDNVIRKTNQGIELPCNNRGSRSIRGKIYGLEHNSIHVEPAGTSVKNN